MKTDTLIYLAAIAIAGFALVQLAKAHQAQQRTTRPTEPERRTAQDDAANYRQELFRSVPDDFWV